MSYCTDRPSLVLGLVLRDKMRVALPPGGNRTGLPVGSAAESKRCVGGVRGVGDNAAVVSCASTKGAPRDRGAVVSWERSRTSTTVEELCVDGGWLKALRRSLVVVVVVEAACGGGVDAGSDDAAERVVDDGLVGSGLGGDRRRG